MSSGETPDALADAKAALTKQLAERRFRPLADLVFDPLGRLGRRSWRGEDYPAWVAAALLVAMVLGVAAAVGWIAGDRPVFADTLTVSVGGAVVGVGALLGIRLLTHMLQASLRDYIVPAISRRAELDEIAASLGRIFDLRRQLAFTLVLGLSLMGMSAAYFAVPMMTFLPRLGRLELRLYRANPRDSPAMVSLADTANHVLYVFSALFAVITFGVAKIEALNNPTA